MHACGQGWVTYPSWVWNEFIKIYFSDICMEYLTIYESPYTKCRLGPPHDGGPGRRAVGRGRSGPRGGTGAGGGARAYTGASVPGSLRRTSRRFSRHAEAGGGFRPIACPAREDSRFPGARGLSRIGARSPRTPGGSSPFASERVSFAVIFVAAWIRC